MTLVIDTPIRHFESHVCECRTHQSAENYINGMVLSISDLTARNQECN